MNNDFKRRLYNLYYDISADFAKVEQERQYERLIARGVRAEQGEDYYLFYFTRPGQGAHNPDYHALLMLYNPFDPVEPVHFLFSEDDLGFEVREKWIRTAVYFLRNKLENTVAEDKITSQTLAPAFARQHIRRHQAKLRSLAQRCRELMEQGAQSIVSVETQRVKLPERSRKQLLPKPPAPAPPGKKRGKKKGKTRRRPRALAGLCLDIQTSPPQMNFIPIVVPMLRRGGTGKPRKATRSLMELYKVETAALPQTVNRFLQHFVSISSEKLYDPLKISLIDSVFFSLLMEELDRMPGGRLYYYIGRGDPAAGKTKYRRLEKKNFEKLSLRFAPSMTRQDHIEISMTVHEGQNQVINAGNRYYIKVADRQAYLFFMGEDNNGFITAAENQKQEHNGMRPALAFLSTCKSFEARYYHEVLTELEAFKSSRLEITGGDLKKYRLRFTPQPVLKLMEPNTITGSGERLKLEFDYRTPFDTFKKQHPELEPVYSDNNRDPRNREFEALCLYMLNQDPMLDMENPGPQWNSAEGSRFAFNGDGALMWLTTSGASYLERGFQLFSQRWNRPIGNVGGQVNMTLNHGMDWLEIKPTLTGPRDGEQLAILEINLEQGILMDENKNLHLVTAEDIEKLKQLNAAAESLDNMFRIPADNYMLIDQLYDARWDHIPELAAKRDIARLLTSLDKTPEFSLSPLSLSTSFKGTLREYQRHGYRWLRFMRQQGFSVCLADDMGLGKTVQTLALLQSLKDENKLKTSLLVMPVSALTNWEMEIQRFTPGLTATLHVGSKRRKAAEKWPERDLVITSYATLRQDIEIFMEFPFDYVILDESQNIKNASSQVSKACKLLKSNYRLALSGTPVENNSLELWSLLDFLMPGFLGSLNWFNRQFAAPVEKEGDQEKAAILKKMVFPFILRRKKGEVEKELPDKTEIVSRLEMNPEQRDLYRQTAARYRKEVAHEIDAKGVGGSSVKILEALMRLRQVCLFPGLIHEDYQNIPSSKFLHFLELMEDILAEGHKVLIFSQFVKVLRRIRDYFDHQGVSYSYLDGSTRLDERGEMIRLFQEQEETRAFLLSLKAGGAAINLTAADYVIIFDPWWNPAVEDQAIDRSHRIGQTRHVLVYRLVMEQSIEEKMLQLQQKKKDLASQLITTDSPGGKFKELDKEEILELFS